MTHRPTTRPASIPIADYIFKPSPLASVGTVLMASPFDFNFASADSDLDDDNRKNNMAAGFQRTRTAGGSSSSQPTPAASSGSSLNNQSTGHSATSDETLGRPKRRFKSSRLNGDYEKPWLEDANFKKTKWNGIIIYILLFLTISGAAVYGYFTVTKSLPPEQCLVFEDNFEKLNLDVWSRSVELGGFGTGAFDWTTEDSKNSFVDSEGLHIVPTLTNETTDINNDQIYNGYTLNLTKSGDCTGTKDNECAIRSNSTKGDLIPPVRSARLTTRGKKSIRYGRVEVVAKLPRGDWLWPAIWMMPEDSKYGEWPRSGEIDIMESRGNDYDYEVGGSSVYGAALHWGPNFATDSWWRTNGGKSLKRQDLAEDFHTYGMEWTEDYLYFYLDSRLRQIFYINFNHKKDFWTFGEFEGTSENATHMLENPWVNSTSPTGNAPFDQKFYLILNVAVGSRNGWFPDNKGSKPWLDDATNAQWMFWSNADQWLPTWGEGTDRGMTVKSVKMWRQGACGGGEL